MRKDNPNITFDELYEKVNTYIKDEKELKLLSRAYLFAYEKHFGQKRLSGEDYITHPLNVAFILSDINADISTLCAALLHDTIEDCDVTVEELTDKFGSEIASLVNGVTKINRLKFTCDNEAVIANHRKILVGLCEDVRIIILKLADRLHNMRTLWILSEKSQKANARETLDILTPIAHRLGINKIKSELEDLSLRYLKPDVYFSIVEKLNQTRKERDSIVNAMLNDVSNLLNEHNIEHEIKGRAKSIYSIYKKLDKGKKFSEIFDLLALRVFVNDVQDCYQALGIIHSKYRPIPKRFKDYIAMPKTNMYQSLHTTVFGLDGYLFEIQIRTYEMDKIAEHGIASHWSYKENGSNVKADMQNAMEQKLQFFREIMELKDEKSDELFVHNVQEEVLSNTIYVFTPHGDVIELPSGSTPIDFAYHVHSDVGNTMVGALVNGNIVSLDYKLNDSDIVKINTNKNSAGPSREWIDIAFTSNAKNKIKSYLNKLDKEEYLKKGTELLQKEVKKKKIPYSEFYSSATIEKLLTELKFSDMNELHVNIGNGKITAKQVINSIYSDTKTKQEMVLDKVINKTDKKKITPKGDIVVENVNDIKINVASCCKPIPGDEIVGYVSKGNGINVHRTICPNISDSVERIIEVKWNNKIEHKYSTDILITASENNNLLINIINKTSNNDITIQSINNLTTSSRYMFNINILVDNVEKLDKFINEVNNINGVMNVERIIK